jgi:hypothetical protein
MVNTFLYKLVTLSREDLSMNRGWGYIFYSACLAAKINISQMYHYLTKLITVGILNLIQYKYQIITGIRVSNLQNDMCLKFTCIS